MRLGTQRREEFRERHVQHSGQAYDVLQAGVPLAPFDASHVRNVHSGPVGELALSHRSERAQFPDTLTESVLVQLEALPQSAPA